MRFAPPRKTYDVCIVGSGAGGGMAAYALTKAGADVVMLEAGGKWFGSRDSKMMVPNYASPRRGASTKTRPFGEFDACDGGWEIEGEPYTVADGTSFLLVARANARRTHESLGTHLSSLRPRRLQAQESRRHRRRLADHVRGCSSLLRSRSTS